MNNLGCGESRLETVISYLLIIGVIISMVLIVAGLIMFYSSYGHLNILLEDKSVFIHGQNFFSFLFELFTKQYALNSAISFLTLGIATLLLTVYSRVVASVIYFAWKKDIKYILITTFVLMVLTLSLALH